MMIYIEIFIMMYITITNEKQGRKYISIIMNVYILVVYSDNLLAKNGL